MNPLSTQCEREYDFALIVGGVTELTEEVADTLYNAGCDDATVSMQYGLLYIEFSRSAKSLQEAVISAIRDVEKAPGAFVVLRVDECNLVTAADIARKIGRSRQLVYQYMNGQRGPGGFPPPACHLDDDHAPLWAWCAVSFWLSQNGMLRKEESLNAEVVEAVNRILEERIQFLRHPDLVKEIEQALPSRQD